MSSYFPLIVDQSNATIRELPSGDNLNLANSSIQNAVSIHANGNVTGGNVVTNGEVNTNNLTITGNVTGNLLPVANITFDLGSDNQRWRDLYLSGNTIFLGNAKLTANATALILENPSGASIVLDGATADISAANISADSVTAVGNISSGNITSLGAINTVTFESTGDVLVGGNLTVQGNLTYINVEDLRVEDPIVILGTGPNGTPLTGNDSLDRGVYFEYYTGAPGNAFVGWQNATGNMIIAADVAFSGNNVVQVNGYGTLQAGNAYLESAEVIGNVSAGNAIVGAIYSDQYYFADGEPIQLETARGANFQIQFAFEGFLDSSPNFTYNSDINLLTVNGNVIANAVTFDSVSASGNITGSNINTANLVSAGSIISDTTINAVGNVTGGNILTSGSVEAANIKSSSTIDADGNITGNNISATSNVNTVNVNSSGTVNTNILVATIAEAPLVITNIIRSDDSGIVTVNDGLQVDQELIVLGPIVSQSLAVAGNVDGANINTSGIVNAASVAVSNTITATGNITGGNLTANAAISAGTTITATGNVTGGNLTTAGTISTAILSVTGNANVGNLGTVGQVIATGNITGGNITGGNLSGTNITGTLSTAAQNNITSVGTLANLLVTGNVGVGTTTPAAKIEVNIAAADTALTAARLNLNAAASASETIPVTNPSLELRRGSMGRGTFVKFINQRPGFAGIGSTADEDNGHDLRFHTGDGTAHMFIDSAGNVTATGNVSATGNVAAGNVTTVGLISATGNISGGNLITANLMSAGSINSNSTITATGNVTAGNFITNGTVAAGFISAADANIANVNIINIEVTNIETTTVDAETVTSNGNVTGGNVISLGIVSAVGNITGGNVISLGIVSAVGNITGGNVSGTSLTGTLLTAAQTNITSLGTLESLTVTGNVTGGNLVTAGLTDTSTLNVTNNANVGNLGTGGLIVATGNITGGNLITAGQVTATGNISGNFFLGNGSQLTGIDATSIQNGTANVRTFENANVTVSAGGIANVLIVTSTGANIAGTLNVTGNVTGANLITVGTVQTSNLIVSGIESVGTLNVSGDTLISGNLTVSGTTFTANVQSLLITDPVLGLGSGPNGAPLTSNDGLDRGIKMFYFTDAEKIAFMGYNNPQGKMLLATDVSIAGDTVTVNSLGTTVVGTLESNVVTATGNVTGGNLKTASVTIGNGPISGVTTISASGNANVGNIGATNAVFTNVTGTVTTAAQPNITSVGTLTSLTVTGNVSGGNLTTSGAVTGNGRALTSLNASNMDTGTLPAARLSGTYTITVSGSATTAGTVTTAAQPNITSVGTLTSLTVTGNTTSGNFIGTLNGSGANVTSIDATNISSGTLAVARGGTGTTTSTGSGSVVLSTSPVLTTPNLGTPSAATLTNATGLPIVAGTTGTLTVARGGTGVTTSTGTGAVVLGTSPTFTTQITVPSIVKSGTNAVGNIGQSDNSFNTVFAKATSAQYADLAEMYVADQQYAPGTVLVFGGDYEVTESVVANDVKVAGVVSTNPAHIMNAMQTGDHTVALALMGRVPCCVVGKIRKGDCLVSSDIPGVATPMTATEYRPGAILGKALEDYDSAEPGIIEVVVGRL
jgi:hypothetical protein